MTEIMLEAAGIAAGYGRKRIVHGVDLQVAKGEVLLVLGHNGAGKTTLMRALFGLLPPDEGAVRYEGRDITGRGPSGNVADGIAFIPQGHGIFRRENRIRAYGELVAFFDQVLGAP